MTKILGYLHFHSTWADKGEPCPQPLTDADKKHGWRETPLYDRDDVLEEAAKVCEGVTHWGLSPTKAAVAQSTQQFCAKAIRAQRSDSSERARAEAAEPAPL